MTTAAVASPQPPLTDFSQQPLDPHPLPKATLNPLDPQHFTDHQLPADSPPQLTSILALPAQQNLDPVSVPVSDPLKNGAALVLGISESGE